MPTTMIVAALSTGVTAATIGFATFGAAFKYFLVSTAMGAALNALTPKPKTGGAGGYSLQGESGAALDHQVIYGETKVGGVRVYDASTGGKNQFLHRIIAYAGHEVDSYQEIYLNDEVVTLDGSGNVTSPSRYDGFVRIKTYLGTTTQAADADLVSETGSLTEGAWTPFHRLQGIAYIYVRFQYNQDAFPNGVPSVSAVVRGKKVFNPATNTTAWSNNPALCLRDYLTSSYGLSQPSSRIDDDLVNAAVVVSNQTVEGENRYTCNGSFITGVEPTAILGDLLTSMGGLLWYGQGKWRMKASAWTEPTVSFDEDDLRSGISLSTRHSRRDNFNSVKGTFRGAASDWQPADYPEVSDPAFLSADNGLVNVLDFTLPFTSSSLTAQRIARIALNRNREQLTFSASFGMRAFQVQVGDFVNITNERFGFVNKPFEVTEWTFGLTEGLDVQTRMTLREISEGVFTGATGAVFENNNTTLPNPFRPVPFGISLSSEVRIVNEHLTNVIFVNVTSSEPFNVERVEVQFKKSSSSTYSIAGVGDLGTYEILDTSDETYDIRVRTFSVLGIRSEFDTITNFVVAGLANPPANVTGFTAEINGASVHLEWQPVPDLDLSYYQIRHALEATGATWANATTAVEKVPRPANSATVPAKAGTYMIRAVDKTGNASGEYTSVVVPAAALQGFTTTLTRVEHPTFTGTKTGCSVSSGKLIITDVTGTPPFSAEYLFSNYIDTGAVRRFRSRIDVANARQDNSAGLWDNLSGLFDTLSGNFDDFTGIAQFADTNIVTYISTTQDDPAGTPLWTDYQKFRAGDFFARAARFKIELISTSTDITPSIPLLTAIVEHN